MSPWTSLSIKKHNKKLSKTKAKKAAKIANAVLEETGNEGLALAVANKQVKSKKKKKK